MTARNLGRVLSRTAWLKRTSAVAFVESASLERRPLTGRLPQLLSELVPIDLLPYHASATGRNPWQRFWLVAADSEPKHLRPLALVAPLGSLAAGIALADSSRKHNPWAHKIYTDAIAPGCDHLHAIRILGRSWFRIIWRLWHDHTPTTPSATATSTACLEPRVDTGRLIGASGHPNRAASSEAGQRSSSYVKVLGRRWLEQLVNVTSRASSGQSGSGPAARPRRVRITPTLVPCHRLAAC